RCRLFMCFCLLNGECVCLCVCVYQHTSVQSVSLSAYLTLCISVCVHVSVSERVCVSLCVLMGVWLRVEGVLWVLRRHGVGDRCCSGLSWKLFEWDQGQSVFHSDGRFKSEQRFNSSSSF